MILHDLTFLINPYCTVNIVKDNELIWNGLWKDCNRMNYTCEYIFPYDTDELEIGIKSNVQDQTK